MAKVTLPPDVTSQQLDAVFRKLLKLPPQEERAVRLRLEGKTYKEVASILNAERQPDAKHIVQMWVFRCCRSVITQLSVNKSYPSSYSDTKSLSETVTKVLRALRQGTQVPGSRLAAEKPVAKSGDKHKKQYLCHRCGSTNLQSQPDRNGKRNSRIHVCQDCGRLHTTAERNTKWYDVPFSLQPQKPYIPFLDEYGDEIGNEYDGEK